LASLSTGSAVRTCGFSYSGKQVFYSTDKAMGRDCEIRFFDVNEILSGGGLSKYFLCSVTKIFNFS